MTMKLCLRSRLLSGLLTLLVVTSMFGCSKPKTSAYAPPQRAPYGYVPPPQQQRPGVQQPTGLRQPVGVQQPKGMSTEKKLAVIAGTAALIYMYNKQKNAAGTGIHGQYYRSKNGRVYYRDEKGNAIWVTPPSGGIQVPQAEAQAYQRAAATGDWNVKVPSSASAAAPTGRTSAPTGLPGPPGPRH